MDSFDLKWQYYIRPLGASQPQKPNPGLLLLLLPCLSITTVVHQKEEVVLQTAEQWGSSVCEQNLNMILLQRNLWLWLKMSSSSSSSVSPVRFTPAALSLCVCAAASTWRFKSQCMSLSLICMMSSYGEWILCVIYCWGCRRLRAGVCC